MATDKNDELARLLGQMADGEHADEESPTHHDAQEGDAHHESPPQRSAPPVRPAASAPPRPVSAAPRAATPKAVSAPARPVPPHPEGAAAPSPRPAASAPLSRSAPRPAAPPQVRPAAPLPPPVAAADVPADEGFGQEPVPEAEGTGDDAVIVPAPSAETLARKPVAPRAKQHLVQTIGFKRTIIPVLLTLGVICITTPMLGLTADSESPFQRLSQPLLWISFGVLCLIFWGFGVLTMFQVRNDIDRLSKTS